MRDPGKHPSKLRVNSWSGCLCACLNSAGPIQAQDAFLEDMELVDVGVGDLSSLVDRFSRQTGGLSDVSRCSFSRYYNSEIKDWRFTMLSPVNCNFGILWGFGTGESGAKYHIEPSLKFGILAIEPIGDNRPILPRLFDVQYPAHGDPKTAWQVTALMADQACHGNEHWGLDHGAWSVLRRLYPDADIPVFQMSIDLPKDFDEHMEIGRQLRGLRDQGVLVLGSGHLVRNPPDMRFDGSVFDRAEELDLLTSNALESHNFARLTGLGRTSALFRKAHPTPDHFIPAMYCLGLVAQDDTLTFFNEGIDLGCTSMRSFVFA